MATEFTTRPDHITLYIIHRLTLLGKNPQRSRVNKRTAILGLIDIAVCSLSHDLLSISILPHVVRIHCPASVRFSRPYRPLGDDFKLTFTVREATARGP